MRTGRNPSSVRVIVCKEAACPLVLVILNCLIILLRNACSAQRSQPSLPIAGWTARRGHHAYWTTLALQDPLRSWGRVCRDARRHVPGVRRRGRTLLRARAGEGVGGPVARPANRADPGGASVGQCDRFRDAIPERTLYLTGRAWLVDSVASTLDQQGVSRVNDLRIPVLIVELVQEEAHGVDPGTLLVVALD